jgi:predicted aspartyl protease
MKAPLRLEDELLLATVEVAHQGRKLTLSRVLIDTGSGSTAFATDAMETIGVQPEEEDIVRRIRGVGGYETIVSKQIERLSIGAITQRDVEIEVTAMGYGFGLEGIIGMDFLMQVGAIIDLAKMEIRTMRKAAQKP